MQLSLSAYKYLLISDELHWSHTNYDTSKLQNSHDNDIGLQLEQI